MKLDVLARHVSRRGLVIPVDRHRGEERRTTIGIDAATERAYRENNGITVSLVWNRDTGSLTVVVHDPDTDQTLRIPAAPASAMDVFRHPYPRAAASHPIAA